MGTAAHIGVLFGSSFYVRQWDQKKTFILKLTPSLREPSVVQQDSTITVDMDKPDVAKEVGYLS
jgi:hypothetical protein